MAASWVMLAAMLVILPASAKSRDSSSGQFESKVTSALRGISQALDHFENTTTKALRFHKQNSDVLHHSLRVLRQNGEVLSSLWRLPDSIKAELNEHNGQVVEIVRNATSNVEFLARDNERLKIELENKNEKVQQLEADLETSKEENGKLLSKMQDLDSNLQETVHEVEELREREKHLAKTVASQNKLIEDIHPLVVQLNVTKQVSEYEKTKRWKALRKGLEVVLDKAGAAYHQLRNISYDDDSPLWSVGFHGYDELTLALLMGGRDPDITDEEGCTLLHGASQGGQLDLARTLLNRGASSEARGGRTEWTPLVYAARWDQLGVVELLKERGADLNAATGDGQTALHWAAWEGHLEVVKYLVAAGASTTARNRWGRTPLENARLHGQTAAVEYLLQFPH